MQMINAQLWLGHFDLWSREDIVMFRHAHCLAGGAQASRRAMPHDRRDRARGLRELLTQAFQFVLCPAAAKECRLALFETKGNA